MCLSGIDDEHVAAAEAKGFKAKAPPQKALGALAISIFDLDDGNFCLAVGESYGQSGKIREAEADQRDAEQLQKGRSPGKGRNGTL